MPVRLSLNLYCCTSGSASPSCHLLQPHFGVAMNPFWLRRAITLSKSTPARGISCLSPVDETLCPPFSGPCKVSVCDFLLPSWPADAEACRDSVHLCPYYPRRCRQTTSALEDSAARVVSPHRRKAGTWEFPWRAPFSPAFRWPEPYARSQHGRCNSEAVQSASQYPLERAASLPVAHAIDLRSPCSCDLSAVIHRPFNETLGSNRIGRN